MILLFTNINSVLPYTARYILQTSVDSFYLLLKLVWIGLSVAPALEP